MSSQLSRSPGDNLTELILVGYTVSMARYLAGANPTKVVSAKADAHPKFPKVDARTTASLAFPTPGGKKSVEKSPREGTTAASTDGLIANLLVSYRLPPVLGFLPACPKVSLRVTGTLGTAKVDTFPAPWIRHTLKAVISKREGGGGPLGKLTNRKLTEYHRGKLLCTTWVASHCFHLSDFDYVCAQVQISA